MSKADNMQVTMSYLQNRANNAVNAGYDVPKWIEFCETLLSEGYTLHLYEARKTVSKYITITRKENDKSFKVRFSNHKPIEFREANEDCDFFVGVTNFKVTNTKMALQATRKYFNQKEKITWEL